MTNIKELPKMCVHCGYPRLQHILLRNHLKESNILNNNKGVMAQKENDSCNYLQCPKLPLGYEYTE